MLDFWLFLSFPFFLDIRQILAHALLGDAELEGGVLLGEAPEIDLLEDLQFLVGQFAHKPMKQSLLLIDRPDLGVELVLPVQKGAELILMDRGWAPYPVVDRARHREHLDVNPVELLVNDLQSAPVSPNPLHERGQGRRSIP